MRILYIIIYIMEDTVICKVQINYWGFSHKEPDLTNLDLPRQRNVGLNQGKLMLGMDYVGD